MNRDNVSYMLTVLVIVAILGSLLIFTNVLGFSEKVRDKNDIITTTTKKLSNEKDKFNDYITEVDNHSILVNDEIVEIELKKYHSLLGFNIDFMVNDFDPAKVNINSIVFINKSDSNNFVKIEMLTSDEYYKQYDDSLSGIYKSGNEIDGYNYSYSFFRGNGLFVKVTKSIKNELITDRISVGMDYMISSLDIVGN